MKRRKYNQLTGEIEYIEQSSASSASTSGVKNYGTKYGTVLEGNNNTASAYTARFCSKLNMGQEDVIAVVCTDSTGAYNTSWVKLWAQDMAAKWTTHTVKFYLWNAGTLVYAAAETVQTGSLGGASKVLHVYCGGASGQGTGYPTYRVPSTGVYTNANIIPANPDLIMIAYGLNDNLVEETIKKGYVAMMRNLSGRYQKADFICIAQHPKTSSHTYYLNHFVNYKNIQNLCGRYGWGFINQFERFVNYVGPAGQDYNYLLSDGIHLNTIGDRFTADGVTEQFSKTNITYPLSVRPNTFGDIVIPVAAFSQFSGTAVTPIAVGTSGYVGLPWDKTSAKEFSTIIRIPRHWQTIAIYILVATADNTAGNITVSGKHGIVNDFATGQPSMVDGTYTYASPGYVGKVVKMQVRSVYGSGEWYNPDSESAILFVAKRDYANAADTYPNTCYFCGIYIEQLT